ncbi:MAG TPA: ABC transporter ATP-binding protein [Chloroflexota bacterium]|nr:ABC transporter ATP-binding protein [Chloroflexota bacterium]
MARVLYQHVGKRFGTTYAVRDFDLDIPDREFLVLVGPSGCGKSTALRLLAGLEQVSEGDIFIGDRKVTHLPPRDRDIAMVFQSYALYPHMTIYDNVAFGLQLRKVPKREIDRRVKEAAGILGIQELLARKPGQLSGGQRQRVAVARAIVREPSVFLLDEPLSNLDANLRVHTRTEISKLHQRLGTTFIYVTHDQVEAMTMATRIAVMSRGVIQQVGTPQELYNHPVNRFVAGFIGSPAMNFLDARVERADGGIMLDAGPFQVPAPKSRLRELEPYVGKTIVFGIRPENVHDRQFAPQGIEGAPVSAKVDVTEMMGNEVFVYLLAGELPMLAQVDPRTEARPQEEMQVVLDMDRMHAFDSETGDSLFDRARQMAAA